MATPQLYRQLLKQLGQWIIPKDLRHLKNYAEIEAAKARLPIGSQPTLLADRGFEHGELMRWLITQE